MRDAGAIPFVKTNVPQTMLSFECSNPLWGPRKNLVVPVGMVATMLIAIVNLYGPGLQDVFATTPIPGMYWGIPFGFAAGILAVDEFRKLLVVGQGISDKFSQRRWHILTMLCEALDLLVIDPVTSESRRVWVVLDFGYHPG